MTKQYGSWSRGDAPLYQLLLQLLSVSELHNLSTSKVRSFTIKYLPASDTQDAFSSWKITYEVSDET